MNPDECLKLLVVDDEEGMRLGMERGLRDHTFSIPEFGTEVCYDITLAEDGETAVAILKEKVFDLVLLDYKLPGINGIDVLAIIQAEQPETTVIMVTAFASLEVAVSATKNGAYDFLAKPFSPRELRDVVSKASQHIMTLREARKLADKNRKIRFEFISVLAHELKSPLAAVENYLNLMDQRISGDDLATYDHAIKRSLSRLGGMRKMILDLLDLTRLESGHFQSHPEWVDLRDTLASAYENMASLASEMDVNLDSKFRGDCKVYGVPAEVEILLNNFISNAIKYNQEGGSVGVYTTSNDSEVVIQIKDTGIGMTPEESAQLFGEFVRIRNDKTRNISGSGLGLSIVKKIIHNLDGHVDVESTPDVGTTFTITLPLPKIQTEGFQSSGKQILL